MFGYLTARAELLEDEGLKRYKAAYCGLCRSLRERHGQAAALTLNYDMTFLVLLLSSLYEPEEKGGTDTCIAHPFSARTWFSSEITAYAADMNMALGYLKCVDNVRDDASLVSAAEAAVLRRSYLRVKAAYPRQCEAMERGLESLDSLEKAGTEDPDAAASAFGGIMGEIFAVKDDRWQNILRYMGDCLGRVIYIMDACMDLETDVFWNGYNPFSGRNGMDNEQYFRDIISMLLGECVRAFDALPCVQDTDILKNILCAGIWTEFDKKFNKMKGSSDV